jgi:Phage Tail Collar Domain
MQRVLSRRPSPAMLVALLALFVSLGGSAYAALKLPRNSVGSAQLKNGAVSTAKLRNGSVTANKVKAHSLTDAKLATPSVTISAGTGLTGGGSIALGRSGALSVAAGGVDTNQLADGAITSSKFAPGAQAPNSAELGGQAPSAYAASSWFGSPVSTSAGGASDSSCVVSEIKLLAGNQYPSDWHLADGSLLSISSNTALFSLLGTSYGGNGTTDFALPDLRGAEPKGRGPAGVNYFICTSGLFP